MIKNIKRHCSIQNGSSVNVQSAERKIGNNENNKVVNNKLNKEDIKMEKIKISVQELVNTQSKEEKRALREKLGITRKQLKMIMKDLEQGKCNVNNGFIYVQTEVNTEDKQTGLIRKQIQKKGNRTADTICANEKEQ